MGFFSWKTSDTKESIANIFSGHKNAERTVYLLQPNGLSNIEENEYEGYGVFGGTDVYVWLAEMNLSTELLEDIAGDEDILRDYGLAIDMGSCYMDKETKKLFGYHWTDTIKNIQKFDGTYGDIMKEYNKTPNELIKEGIWVECKMRNMICDFKYPLKFSYNKETKYEEVSAADICETQGYFY